MSTVVRVPTLLGNIAVETETREGSLPIIFLHGVYLDRHLWDAQASAIRQLDIAVVIMPDHGFEVAKRLTAPALALRGEKDYVPEPPNIPLTIVPGGHISPLEAPSGVQDFVQEVIKLAESA